MQTAICLNTDNGFLFEHRLNITHDSYTKHSSFLQYTPQDSL